MAQDLREKKEEQIMSSIQTWEDKKKTKVDNKADKRLGITAEEWNADKIDLEAEEKKIETRTEQLRQKLTEKLKNKEASSVKSIEDKKVKIEVQRNKEHHNIEKKAEKFRSSKSMPTKFCGMCVDK